MRRLREAFVRRVARISGNDVGVVALMVALMLPVIIGLLAFAVDVSNWYLVQQKEQKAADDASLAGVIYLPADPCTAYSTAFAVAGQNGFPTNTSGSCTNNSSPAPLTQSPTGSAYTVTVQLGGKPGELQVTITKNVQNSFAGIFNVKSTGVTKSSTAAFSGPAAMGSPCNVLGNENMLVTTSGGKTTTKQGNEQAVGSTACGTDGNYWLEDAGYNTSKLQGDALQSNWCSDSTTPIDGCSGTTSGGFNNNDVNQEYAPTGYAFNVHVPTNGNFNLEVFDGIYADTGVQCNSDDSDWTNATAAVNPYVTDANKRYVEGNTSFCAGDHSFGTNSSDGTATNTTYILRQPAASAADPLSGAPICTITLNGYKASQLTGGAMTKLLNLGATTKTPSAFAEYFHRWGPIAVDGTVNPSGILNATTVDSPNGCATTALHAAGDYVLQVMTGNSGGGQNGFGLRGYYSGSAYNSSVNANVSITALQRVGLYINDQNAANPDAVFHLVRLGSGAGGHTLTVQFFDFGDNPAQAAESVKVYAPDNSSLASGTSTPFTGCVGARYPGSTGKGATVGNLGSSCGVTISYSNGVPSLNGQWQLIQIPIPTNYTCNADTNVSDCWVRVQVFPPSGGITDTTTWGASLSGDPVRLVQ